VKLANGDWMLTSTMVQNLNWFIQGETLSSDMLVLEMGPYDAILGYDWLKKHSPMTCDWNSKTLSFQDKGRTIKLHGITDPPLAVSSITATQLYKGTMGNDTWALVLIDSISSPAAATNQTPPCIQKLLEDHKAIFQDPKTLPPPRSYDHAIPLTPGAVPVNARPYHYSPQHKSEIEQQVQQLLEAGLISHSHSPFASPVLLVKKKDGTWRMCVDYRKLNELTIKNRFPMPLVDEILDELSGGKILHQT
jgi:hypothetical protein